MTVWICWLFYDCSGVISCILVPKSGKCRDHFLPVGKGPIIFPRRVSEGDLVQRWFIYPEVRRFKIVLV